MIRSSLERWKCVPRILAAVCVLVVVPGWVIASDDVEAVALDALAEVDMTALGGTGAFTIISNVSTRGQVGTGADVLIGGFIVEGPVPKQVLVRALGPTLGAPPFNVPGALSDPVILLTRVDGTVVAQCDDWGNGGDCGDAGEILATNLAPPNALEPAILINLAPGTYTPIVSGFGGLTGVGIIEAYDLEGVPSIINADTLNGLTSSQFLRSDIVNTAVGLNVVGPNFGGSFTVHDFPGGGTQLIASVAGNGFGGQLRFVGAGATFVDIGENAAGDFVVEGSDTPRLTVQHAGNVGIGTSTPSAKLQVVGDTSLGGPVTLGGELTFADGSVLRSGRADPGCADSNNRFVDCGNGTVTDTVTGRIWLKDAACLGGSAAYSTQFAAAANLSHGQCGLTDNSSAGDWRLPSKEDWESLLGSALANGCPTGPGSVVVPDTAGTGCWSEGDPFTGLTTSVNNLWWSSTVSSTDPSNAWTGVIDSGTTTVAGPRTAGAPSWAVRGEQVVSIPLPTSLAGTQSSDAGTVGLEELGEPVEVGDVLVMSQEGRMAIGRFAADAAVVGIVTEVLQAASSSAGKAADVGVAGDLQLTRSPAGQRISVAHSGVVLCKVDAGYGSVRPGDLLTTSPTAGHAMRAEAPGIGTVLGKALEPLDTGTGQIRVLVMLQ